MESRIKHTLQGNLTDDQKALLQEIREQIQNDNLTKEVARTQLEEASKLIKYILNK